MKIWIQIYVIWILISVKMKQIVMLFFTFSGISSGYAQTQSAPKPPTPVKNFKNDSTKLRDKYFARLYPNPAKNKLFLDVKGFEPGFLQMRLFDNRGNKLRDEKRMLFNGNETITVMFSLQPGIYLVVLKQNDKLVKKNLMVR